MRTFVGIDLDETWRDLLSTVCRAIRAAEPAWVSDKWVPEENLHLTVKFLGELPDEMLPRLAEDLAAACSRIEPFALPLDRAVVPVPQAHRARMLWSCFDDSEGRCSELASAIDDVTATYGVPPENREFRAHVTLVRARRPHALGPGGQAGDETVSGTLVDDLRLPVHAVTLFASKLTRQGAVYDRMASMTLGMR